MAPRHYGVPHPQVELDPERERAPDTCLQPTFKQNGGFKTHQGTGSRCLRPPPHSHQGNSWAPSSVRRWTTRFQGRPKGRRRASAWRSDPTCFEAPTQWTHSGHMESDGIGKLLITADVGAASSSRSSRLSASAGRVHHVNAKPHFAAQVVLNLQVLHSFMSNANGEEAPRPAKPRVGVGGYEPRGLSEATHRVATEHVLGMSFKHSFNIVFT